MVPSLRTSRAPPSELVARVRGIHAPLPLLMRLFLLFRELGVGVAAQKGGEPWSEFANNCLPILFEVISRPNAREDDDVFATENACASIAKILHYNNTKVANVQDVVNAWVDTLPIVNDEEAAPYAYAFLAQLIDQ